VSLFVKPPEEEPPKPAAPPPKKLRAEALQIAVPSAEPPKKKEPIVTGGMSMAERMAKLAESSAAHEEGGREEEYESGSESGSASNNSDGENKGEEPVEEITRRDRASTELPQKKRKVKFAVPQNKEEGGEQPEIQIIAVVAAPPMAIRQSVRRGGRRPAALEWPGEGEE
jgi:hypothetical protein